MYSNTITSLVSLPAKEEYFESLKDLLDHGYKILSFAKSPNMKFKSSAYLPQFRSAGYVDKIDTSILEIDEMYNGDTAAHHLQNSKCAVPYDEDLLDTFIKEMEERIHRQEIRFKCHFTKESIRQGFRFWTVRTTDRYRVIETLNTFKESGLDIIWDRWSEWAARLIYGISTVTNKRVFNLDGLVTWKNCLTVIIFCSFLYNICILVFLYEAIISRYFKL